MWQPQGVQHQRSRVVPRVVCAVPEKYAGSMQSPRTAINPMAGHSPEQERPLASFDAFVDWAGRYREIGVTELVLHWPIADSEFAADQKLFERIATEGLAHVDG